MNKIHLVICPFLNSQSTRVDAVKYFRINIKRRTIEYNVIGTERNRIMEAVSKKLRDKINENGSSFYDDDIFSVKFGAWFKKLNTKRIPRDSSELAILEKEFLDEAKEIIKGFLPFTTTEKVVEENQKPAEIKEPLKEEVKAGKEIVFELKTGKVKLSFENDPTDKDLEILHQYLIYKFS